MSYIRGLQVLGATAPPKPDPWASTAEPGLLEQIGTGITSLFGKAASVISAPAAPAHPAPLTEAEKAKLLGTAPTPSTTAIAPPSKFPIKAVAIAGVVGLMALGLVWKARPRTNPRRRRRR